MTFCQLKKFCFLFSVIFLLGNNLAFAKEKKDHHKKQPVKHQQVKQDQKKKVVHKKDEVKKATKITEAPKSDIVTQDTQFYLLLDSDTGEVLLSKNIDSRIAPSSMTKMMTAYVVFDQIKKGKITLQNQCLVGRDAWRKSGSSMFLNYGDVVTIDQLLQGLFLILFYF